MGIYMSATAIIGVKFTLNEPVKTTSHKRGCEHPPIEDMEFCGQCGAPLWKPQTSYAHQFEEIEDDFIDPVLKRLNSLLNGCAVVEADNEWENFYIGYGATCDDFEETKLPLLDRDTILDALAITLGEIGVWDSCKDSFGLWVVSTGH